MPRRSVLRGLAALAANVYLGAGCEPATGGEGGATPRQGAKSDAMGQARPVVDLPEPELDDGVSLVATLRARRSERSFAASGVDPREMGQLMWSAQGITASWGGRTAPSAGALYPLRLLAATEEALYRYVPDGHSIETWLPDDVRQSLWVAGLRQAALAQAPLVFAITSLVERTRKRYGSRANRYVYLEAGHAAQNLLLQAVALGLGAVVIGAFDDARVAAALQLTDEEEPVYLIPVGYRIG